MDITEYDDVIDSRDVIERIAELESELDEGWLEGSESMRVPDWVTCGTCGFRWNDAVITERTPVPSGRCPVEGEHEIREELADLRALASQGEDYCEDWVYGEALIRDSYFVVYAQELAEDIGAIASDIGWPYACVDWERAARELQTDYTAIEFRGITYWAR